MTLATVPDYDDQKISRVGERAVVVGGSIAGLCAARVLADAFEEVTVLERDPLPDEPVARRGVPQATQPHLLLEAGRASLEELLPGFSEDLVEAGAVVIDDMVDFTHYLEGGTVADTRETQPMYGASRPLIEQIVRRHVAQLPDVHLRDGCTVTEYLVDDAGTSVTGVAFREGTGDEYELDTELVVDATGRASSTPSWLERQGYESPPVDEVEVDVVYASALVERPPDDERTILVMPNAPRTRGGAAFPVEDGHWLVGMGGMHGDHPPGDREGMLEFASTLPRSELARLLETHDWVDGEVTRYPFPSNRRNRYEELDRFPTGFVVVGDAIASFNPIYGQGMSVAALEARQLHHALADGGLDGLADRYFDRTAEVVDVAWNMSAGADLQFPQTNEPAPLAVDLFSRYLSRVIRAAHTDRSLATALYRVISMEKPPTSLLRPGVVGRVLAGSVPSIPNPGGSSTTVTSEETP